MSTARLEKRDWDALVVLALSEDIAGGDVTAAACIPADAQSTARLVAKQDLILCGVELAMDVFRRMDAAAEFTDIKRDGARLKTGDVIFSVAGNARALLAAERTALNFMQHLSGVATQAAQYAAAVAGTGCKVVDTRKTTPGMRVLQKYAVRCGGAHNHRHGLFDGILIKENHIRAAGSIEVAVAQARTLAHHLLKVEVEVTTLDELDQALNAGADVIMLDNFDTADIQTAVSFVGGRALLEVSGGVTLARIAELAATGVDLISVGALTHSAPASDISMLFSTD